MATIALPIQQIEQSVRVAHKATEWVTSCSRSQTADVPMVLKVAGKTIWLKYRFSCLSKLEDKLIAHLTDHDFSELNAADLVETAVSIENLVAMQRDILNDVHELGTEIRVWWKRSIEKLTEQTEHLESIAESFRFAADPEATALLALAAEHLAVR